MRTKGTARNEKRLIWRPCQGNFAIKRQATWGMSVNRNKARCDMSRTLRSLGDIFNNLEGNSNFSRIFEPLRIVSMISHVSSNVPRFFSAYCEMSNFKRNYPWENIDDD